MPTLNVIHDSIDDIPENYRDLYTGRDGKFALTGITGLKTQVDVDAIKTHLQTERDAHKATKAKYHDFADMDANDIQAKLGRLAELEILTAGQQEDFDKKLEDLTEARVRSRLSPLERDAKRHAEVFAAVNEEIAVLRSEKVERTILDGLRITAAESKLPTESMADAELLAQNIFTIDEASGRPVTRENRLGFTEGVEVDVFMLELKEKRPHWWPASSGGDAQGSGRGNAYPNNPWSKDHWNITQQGQVFKDHGRDKAEQMAKAAGTLLGSGPPQK